MKKPEIIPTVSLLIFTIVNVAIIHNWRSVSSAISASEPFAKVFSIFGLCVLACASVASVYFFVKSMIKGGKNE